MGFLWFFWKPYLNPNISGWQNGMFHCGEGWLINLLSNHHFSGHINEVHTQSLGHKGEGAWSPQVTLYHLVGLKKDKYQSQALCREEIDWLIFFEISPESSWQTYSSDCQIRNTEIGIIIKTGKRDGELPAWDTSSSSAEIHLNIRTEGKPDFTQKTCFTKC